MALLAKHESDLKELETLLAGETVQSDRVRAALEKERAAVQKDIRLMAERARAQEAREAAATAAAAAREAGGGVVRAPAKEFKAYSWEQTAKAIKIRATYPAGYGPFEEGCQQSSSDADNIRLVFDTPKGSVRLVIENLEKPIVAGKIGYKFKAEYVLLTFPKETDGQWFNLKTKDLGQAKAKESVCRGVGFVFFVLFCFVVGRQRVRLCLWSGYCSAVPTGGSDEGAHGHDEEHVRRRRRYYEGNHWEGDGGESQEASNRRVRLICRSSFETL